MTTAGIVSWVAYLAGLGSFIAFLGIWFYRVRPWRRRGSELPAVRRARVFLFMLTMALGTRYVREVINLITTHGHPVRRGGGYPRLDRQRALSGRAALPAAQAARRRTGEMIMVRRCADSVTPTDIPVNDPATGAPWALVMGYIDGHYAWSADGWNRFPGSRKVRVAVFSTTNAGDVIDREQGDATATQAVDWVVMRRAAGHPNPIVYCSYSDWQNCRDAFTSRGVTQPAWWIAGYPSPTDSAGRPIIPAGAVAHQFTDTPGGHWDESIVVDYVPGIDPSGADMDEQSIARAVWGMTVQPNGLTDSAGKQVAYPAGDIIGYGDDFARQAKDASVAAVAKVDAIADTVKALTASVEALTTEVAALKSAQQPGISGTFSISGSGSVSTPAPNAGS